MHTLQEVSVPAIGWLVMPVGLILAVVSPRWLYLSMIFAIPFSATAVVNFGASGGTLDSNAFGIQAAIFLGCVWLVRDVVTRIKGRDLTLPASIRTTALLLLGFLAAATLSLVMPAIVNGHFLVRTSNGSWSFAPLTFSLHDVTQLAYLAYGVTLALFVAARLVDTSYLQPTVQAFVAGGVGLAIWGWMQFIVLVTGHSYPGGILNTNVHPAAQGHQEVLHLSVGTVHRLSSAADEPSIFAQTLLTTLALLGVLTLKGHTVFSRRLDLAALFVIVSVALLSTATTAYVGMALLVIIVLASLTTPASRRRYSAAVAGVVVVASLFYLTVPKVHAVAGDTIFSKSKSWSAAERLSSVKDAWWHFVNYPLLGTGWGTASSHDLVVFLLANSGVLGFVLFLTLAAHLLWELRIGESMHTDTSVPFALASRAALLMVLFLNLVTGFAFTFGHVWLVIALAAGCGAMLQSAREPAVEPLNVSRPTRLSPISTVGGWSRARLRSRGGRLH